MLTWSTSLQMSKVKVSNDEKVEQSESRSHSKTVGKVGPV